MPKDSSKAPAAADAAADAVVAEAAAEAQADQPKKADDGLRTPTEWAEQLGLLKRRDPRLPQSEDVFNWRHAAAAVAYGWSEHAYHHRDKPFRLAADDYRKALASIDLLPTCELHAAAIPDSQKARMGDFKKQKRHDRASDWKARGMKREESR